MGKKTALKESLRKFVSSISIDYPIRKMYLFGSRATGKAGKDSDVDLLLVSPAFQGKRKLKRAPPLYLRWNLKYPVDFICLTPEEFQQMKKGGGIIQEAVEKGIKII